MDSKDTVSDHDIIVVQFIYGKRERQSEKSPSFSFRKRMLSLGTERILILFAFVRVPVDVGVESVRIVLPFFHQNILLSSCGRIRQPQLHLYPKHQ